VWALSQKSFIKDHRASWKQGFYQPAWYRNGQSKDFKASDYKKIALIESSTPGVNNLLPQGTKVSIVIDHHQANIEDVEAEYIDIRPNIGATSDHNDKIFAGTWDTIKTELATALLYGIKVDTNDFRRKHRPRYMTAAAYLFPLANNDILDRLETPSKSTSQSYSWRSH